MEINGVTHLHTRSTADSLNPGVAVDDPCEMPPTKRRYHEGWLLNLGHKVQTLAWAPNRSNASNQYLAIACATTISQRASTTPRADNIAPAFAPSPPYPSCIQLWSFSSICESNSGLGVIDFLQEPKLVQVWCTEWGDIRQLTWCVEPREAHSPKEPRLHEVGAENLGLLATVTSDGCARVIDATIAPLDRRGETRYFYSHTAAFTAPPTKTTICTTATFASSRDLIVGTSAGTIGIFDIAKHDGVLRPKPYMTHQLQTTYLLALASCQPSRRPLFLASLSAPGAITLTDLNSPSQDAVSAARTRLPTSNLVYSSQLQCLVTTQDGAGNASLKTCAESLLVCHPLRRFFGATVVGRVPGRGAVTKISGSRWHPCILAGTSGGGVVATNPLRKFLPQSKKAGPKRGGIACMQKLCEYEWMAKDCMEANRRDLEAANRPEISGARDLVSEPENDSSFPQAAPVRPWHKTENSVFHGHDTRPGVSRFHEGFKAERVDARRVAPGPGTHEGEDLGYETIYEDEQSVTTLEWNPNLQCSGWIAVGWGSGLVRVQDVAHGDV